MLLALALALTLTVSVIMAEELVEMGQRIVGGTKAAPNEFPYQLAFEIMGDVQCGASIVNERWAITAAHCTAGYFPQDFKLIAGEHSQSKEEKSEQHTFVTKIVNHPKYIGERNNHRDDIALLKVETPFRINKYVQSIALANPGPYPTGNVTVTGWGRTQWEGETSDKLQKVTLPIVPFKDCEKAYLNTKIKIIDTVICAGLLGVGGKDSCQGDSGGPLAQLSKGSYTLLGIVSMGGICASKEHPGIYTNVGSYRSWIDSVVSEK